MGTERLSLDREERRTRGGLPGPGCPRNRTRRHRAEAEEAFGTAGFQEFEGLAARTLPLSVPSRGPRCCTPAGPPKAEQAEAALRRKVPRAGVSPGDPHGRRAPQQQPRCPRAALREPGPRPTRCFIERRIPLRATRRSFGTDCQQPSEPRSCWFGSESPVWFINL